jgi:hypothetical protein
MLDMLKATFCINQDPVLVVKVGFHTLRKIKCFQLQIQISPFVKPEVYYMRRVAISHSRTLEGCTVKLSEKQIMKLTPGPITWVSLEHLAPKKPNS